MNDVCQRHRATEQQEELPLGTGGTWLKREGLDGGRSTQPLGKGDAWLKTEGLDGGRSSHLVKEALDSRQRDWTAVGDATW